MRDIKNILRFCFLWFLVVIFGCNL
jgi:hypothetical protein